MARQGRAAQALLATAVASFVGGSLGITLMTLFSSAIASFALSFTSWDYFAVMLLGLVASASVATGAPLKGIVAVILGVLLGTIGTDVSTGVQRYTMGYPELIGGLSLVALAMGLFGISEMISSAGQYLSARTRQRIRIRDMLPERAEVRRSVLPAIRGSSLGSLLGALPGAGANHLCLPCLCAGKSGYRPAPKASARVPSRAWWLPNPLTTPPLRLPSSPH